MKFDYEYRTSENELRFGFINASDREAAFAALRSIGIRPARLKESPGFFNLLFGKGKRWIAIGALLLIVIGLFVFAMRTNHKVSVVLQEVADQAMFAERSQIYGDPTLLKHEFDSDWSDVFTNGFDRLLAAYGIPGRTVVRDDTSSIMTDAARSLKEYSTVGVSDFDEIAKMKRIVNGMKREANAYLAAGGTVASYIRRLEKRQRDEVMYLARIRTELQGTDDISVWRERNSSLRSMGLPMIAMPDEDREK